MKKFIVVGLLLVSVNSFSSLPDLTTTMKDIARFPILVHYINQVNNSRDLNDQKKTEFKNYIGNHLFGTDWETYLPLAQRVVAQNGIQGVFSDIYAITILEILIKARSEGRSDIQTFMNAHDMPGVFEYQFGMGYHHSDVD